MAAQTKRGMVETRTGNRRERRNAAFERGARDGFPALERTPVVAHQMKRQASAGCIGYGGTIGSEPFETIPGPARRRLQAPAPRTS